MGKTDTKSHRRAHTVRKKYTGSTISLKGMNIENLIKRNTATSAKPMSARKKVKNMLRRIKTFKVKPIGEKALSMVAESGDPVKQVKELGELIQKHSDYLYRKHTNAPTNNAKAIMLSAHSTYDLTVSHMKRYLDEKVREFGAQYVQVHGFAGVPEYEEGDNIYEDVENLTEFLADFKETIQTHAPEMMPKYITMMREVVTELMKLINTSRESVGENKANNVNALADLLAGL